MNQTVFMALSLCSVLWFWILAQERKDMWLRHLCLLFVSYIFWNIELQNCFCSLPLVQYCLRFSLLNTWYVHIFCLTFCLYEYWIGLYYYNGLNFGTTVIYKQIFWLFSSFQQCETWNVDEWLYQLREENVYYCTS